jgi:hypothetical protein
MRDTQTAAPRGTSVAARPVLFFDEIDSALLPLVGGKGANLGELTRAEFPVPPASVSPRRHTSRSPGAPACLTS